MGINDVEAHLPQGFTARFSVEDHSGTDAPADRSFPFHPVGRLRSPATEAQLHDKAESSSPGITTASTAVASDSSAESQHGSSAPCATIHSKTVQCASSQLLLLAIGFVCVALALGCLGAGFWMHQS